MGLIKDIDIETFDQIYSKCFGLFSLAWAIGIVVAVILEIVSAWTLIFAITLLIGSLDAVVRKKFMDPERAEFKHYLYILWVFPLTVATAPALLVALVLYPIKRSKIKRDQWKKTLPGLIDTAKRLSKEGMDLFKKNEYQRALNAFEESLSKFSKAKEATKHDPELAKSIKANVSGIRTNIIACNISVGSSISGEAKKQFDGGNPEGALDTYNKALPYLEKALNDATQIRDDENINRAKNLKEQVKANIEGCLIAMDNTKVEHLFERAKSLLAEALKVKEKRELYKARDKLKEVHSIIDEAFGLATKRDFTEAKVTLSNLLQQVRGQMNSVYDLIAGGVEEISIEGGVDQVKAGAAPNIPLMEKEVLRKAKPSFGFPEELREYYEQSEYLDEGGSSWVYRARRKKDGAMVAIKILKHLDKETAKSFIDEIQIWKELDHKNIARIYDYSSHPRPHIDMELLAGSIENLIPLDPRKAGHLIFKIADGLRYAHGRPSPVFHLDLKPGNIMLTVDKEPKIVDWGLAKIVRASKQSVGQARGRTTLYATPEHISEGKVDGRTDIFQLGQIFYELVTGRPPFEADSDSAIMEKIMRHDPALPSSINHQAKFVEPVIMRCLEKEKERRYQSIEELHNELANILEIEQKQVKISMNTRTRITLNCDLLDTLLRQASNLTKPEDRHERMSALNKCIECLKSLETDMKNRETKDLISHQVDALNYYIERDLKIDSNRLLTMDEIIRKARLG
ncbi:serine/threonine protein kinase [Dehalococcoidia bacterium]|nr:serine/threonine protein kinase [Dehalococcoidia bacterium]